MAESSVPLGYKLGTPLQQKRRTALARQLRALVETPTGAARVLEAYARVAPADAAEILKDWWAWFQRTHPGLAAQLAAHGVPDA